MSLVPMNPGISMAVRGLPALLLLVALAPTRAEESALQRAESLLETERVAAALEVLTPLEAEHAGEAQFDYLLGRARLASGQPGSAALTLERAVAIDPAFAAARMELARAYYESGALADAQREFLLLSAQNPPPAARRTISEYLEWIVQPPI